jgi:hypothetical protein
MKTANRWCAALLAGVALLLGAPGGVWAQEDASVWVEVYPAFFSSSPVDHTYLLAQDSQGAIKGCPCLGGQSGGHLLADSQRPAPDSALERILYMCNQEPPCAWPVYLYMVVGVCHQMANRGLYSLDSTVEGAAGYGMSHYFYGVYGFTAWADDYDFNLCLEHAPALPPPPSPAPAARKLSAERPAPAPPTNQAQARPLVVPDPQVALYREFRRSLGDIPPGSWDPKAAELYKAYAWRSVALRLRQTLGDQAAEELQGKVMHYWSANYDKQMALRREFVGKMLKSKQMEPRYEKGMNRLLMATQDQFRQLFSPLQYEAFFLLPWPKKSSQLVQWRWFQDEPGPAAQR